VTIYISLLRGINVSGQKIIKMADLKGLYQSLSLQDVKTYIQSGNVIFTSDIKAPDELATKISQAIFAHYQFEVPIFVLTLEMLKGARQQLPFDDINLDKEGSKVLLCFLSGKPDNAIELLSPYLKSNERLCINDNVLYIYCPDGSGRTKLTHRNIEQKLQLSATSRNLKTVDKLIELGIC